MATKKMSMGGDTTGKGASKEKKGMTMEKMGKVKADGKRAFGEHTLQEKGHTRGKQVKMAGNTIGNGPLYNVKGPAMKKGGKVSSASKRGDGCAVRGKTKGRMV